jgi:anti-sigma regulatory factor (Ser/Thr protein kinase)
MTCLVALFDFNKNKLKFISAGHPSLFMYDASTGKTELLDCGNRGAIPVGWLKDYKFDSEKEMIEVDFSDNNAFFGVTDGIIEINNSEGNTLGLEKLQSLLEESASEIETPLVPYYVCEAVKKSGYNVIEDDICMIMVKKNLHSNGEDNHLQLTTSPNITHANMLGMEYERFIIEKTEDEMLAVRTELLLNEFLNNIIMHGLEKRQQEGPKILVDLMINNEDIQLKVWDKGKPWSFNTSPIDIDEGIWDTNNKFATAGRGMAIIKSIAGKIECSRYGDLNETSFVIAREG